MSDVQLLLGFDKVERHKLTNAQKEEIINNIGVFAEFASSVSSAAAHGASSELHAQTLSFAASFLADMAGELNGLIQT